MLDRLRSNRDQAASFSSDFIFFDLMLEIFIVTVFFLRLWSNSELETSFNFNRPEYGVYSSEDGL